MRLVELSDAASFLQRSSVLLLKAEAENNLLLSSVLTLAKSSAGRSPKLSFFVVEKDGACVCSALNATNRRLLLSTASLEAARYMGASLAERTIRVRGLIGPSSSAEAFKEGFLATAPVAKLTPSSRQRILRLESLSDIKLSSGFWRIAKDKDLKLLIRWSHQFVKECRLDEPPEETEEVVHRYLENRQLYIWEDQRPVAMAGFGGYTPNGVRVNMVYTDPEGRARGYAGSLVHTLSRKLLASDRKFCFLFVNAADPVANRVYERLGYREVGEFTEFRESVGSLTSR